MPIVVGIRFKDSGKTYFFDPRGLDLLTGGDHVIVETVRGLELAKIIHPPHEVSEAEIVGELKPVIRRAEDADFERMRLLSERHEEVLARCSEKVLEHNLPMRLVKAEYSFDGSRLTFYFTSEKRVDFRMLVRDLARTFKTRIELRQIGPRDEAKLLGGIGPCGRMLCCATFLPDYARVSIKMAKDQDLPLNPTKISGVCGRLLCCLSYEHDQYLAIKAELPRKGSWVQTPDGPGEVVTVNVVRETVIVELAGSGVHEEFRPDQISEAAQRVAHVARNRAEEGVTPHPLPPPRREPKHHGERRLLRDEVLDPDILDALAMLEEGSEASHARPAERPQAPRPDQRPPQQQARPDQRPPQQHARPADRPAQAPRPEQRPQPPQQQRADPPALPPLRVPEARVAPPLPPSPDPLDEDEEEGPDAPNEPTRPGAPRPPRQRRRRGKRDR